MRAQVELEHADAREPPPDDIDSEYGADVTDPKVWWRRPTIRRAS